MISNHSRSRNIRLVRKDLLRLEMIVSLRNLEKGFRFLGEACELMWSLLHGCDFREIEDSRFLCFVLRISFRHRCRVFINIIIPAFDYLLREKIKYCLILDFIDINFVCLIFENLLKVIREFQTLFSCFPFMKNL